MSRPKASVVQTVSPQQPLFWFCFNNGLSKVFIVTWLEPSRLALCQPVWPNSTILAHFKVMKCKLLLTSVTKVLDIQAERLVEEGRIISVQTRTELNQQADNLEQEIRQLELRWGRWSSGEAARAQVRQLELSWGSSHIKAYKFVRKRLG